MPAHTEITRFTSSGKTFFFNKGEARNGTDYLIINALHGQRTRQGITLLPGQYMEFASHLNEAIEGLTGFKKSDDVLVVESDLPQKCPECGNEGADWEVVVFGVRHWRIDCQCGTVIYYTKEATGGKDRPPSGLQALREVWLYTSVPWWGRVA